MNKEKILLARKISKMSYEDLKDFRKNCTEKEKEDLENYLKNPYYELYNENKDLSKIEFEDRVINLNFDNLKLSDDFIDSGYFTLRKNNQLYNGYERFFTTKQMFYFMICNYLEENKALKDDFKRYTNTQIKAELKEISKLKSNLLSYIKKQKNDYMDITKINQPTEIEKLYLNDFSIIPLEDRQIKLYKDMLQDLEDTEKKLIKHYEANFYSKETLKYKLLKDMIYYLNKNYKFQKETLKNEINVLEDEIKNFDKFKEGLSQMKTKLNDIKAKLKEIPKDETTKIQHFLNDDKGLNLSIHSTNLDKYLKKDYIKLYILDS